MKKIFTLSLILTFCQMSLFSQRYVEEIFDDVQVTADVTYGINPTLLFIAQAGEAVTQELQMDIYEPAGDEETARPLVLVFHTGNFLPNVTNGQIAGERVDSSAVEICTQLAKRGFVAASVSYRLGWNPLAGTQPERALGLIQAAYRGIQDGRSAIRYMRRMAAEADNPYGIDAEKITVWGNGTGGYLVLGLATLDDYSEIVTTENGPGKFLLDLDGDGTPETPMVVEAYHGDINGEVTTVAPDGAFGYPAGDTTTIANHVGYSSDVQLTINVGGALGDVSWIDENTGPILSVQSPFDIFAPYDDAVLIVPTTNDPIVQVQGGLAIHRTQAALGNNSSFADGIFTDASTIEAMASAEAAGHEYIEGLYPFITPLNSAGIPEGVVINWWDPNAPAPGQGMGIPWNMLPHPSGDTFHDQGLILNENMSAEKSRANIAKIMDYVIPRTCLALELAECNYLFTNTEDVLEDDLFLSISPNPVENTMFIDANDQIIKTVEIYALNGSLIAKYNNIEQTQFEVNKADVGTGMYLVKTGFENGFSTRKVVFK